MRDETLFGVLLAGSSVHVNDLSSIQQTEHKAHRSMLFRDDDMKPLKIENHTTNERREIDQQWLQNTTPFALRISQAAIAVSTLILAVLGTHQRFWPTVQNNTSN